MPHETPLITAIVAGIVLAFVFGAVANRIRVPPLVGYLLAGVVVGPFTPGLVVDQELVLQLAEIGVILLMFGVGMHFSLDDLMSVKAIAVPGAIAQIAAATLLGMGLAWSMGWSPSAGFMFGLALSTASTVVLLRALQERRALETEKGRIAVGWLIVEDLAMVLTLVLMPALAGLGTNGLDAMRDGDVSTVGEIAMTLAITLGKVIAFVVLMLVVGRRVVPWLLHYIAHSGSRELFRLAVLAIALGIAYGASELFGVSFALGAFFAGMILSESELSQQAAQDTLPLRDAFAVLFFVSVGMLFDPTTLIDNPWPVLGTLAIILFGKSIAAFVIVRAFGYPVGTALTISASLAQIGEFSFILVALGIELDLLPTEGRDLILAGAILSIMVNPLAFIGAERMRSRVEHAVGGPEEAPAAELTPVDLTGHAVVVGYGRVGKIVADGLIAAGRTVLVIEDNPDQIERLRARGVPALSGNAAQARILHAASLGHARSLFVAIPNAFEAGQIVAQGRAANTQIDIVARAHFDAEVDHLERNGANLIIMGEREIARGMLEHALGAEGRAAAGAAS
ncbi:MAG TPA: YbaL family putative K(+) efflux transporter [Alphaproteobacteria bacterium]|jgi:CPA2 family monovalent cation:H+ antiporter-2|nr:YbaL family putative K(+) efflux transporter [Alphaproteobacteria bacterium]